VFANAAHRRRALATKKDLILDKSESGLPIAPARRRAIEERPYGAPWTPAPRSNAQGREAMACRRPSTRLQRRR
jgi:hypothetical protein